jgi:serine/threonine protein kinase/Tol biopolymer transport system component
MEEEPTQREIGVPGILGLPFPGSAALTGRTLSHFRIDAVLGGGGMGVVYRAEDLQLHRTVALKVLAPELVRDPIAKARFLTEARSASALDHPNVCTILEVGETEEGLLYLVMPCYTGESLETRIARGPLPVEEALDFASQIAGGLAKAHQHGIVHRDIKPANLFLTANGVKILDFGIAKLLGQVGPTRIGASLGTPSYMAPEQTRGQEVDARADVWSLGVVLYEMLAGRRPFVGGSDSAVIYAVLHEPPEPLPRLRPEVPREVERIVSRMLAKDPGQRYADAGEVLAELCPEPAAPPAEGRSSLRRVLLAGSLVLGLAAAAGTGFLAWRDSREPPQPGHLTQLTDLPGKANYPSLSPDGERFVYVLSEGGHSRLYSQRVDGHGGRVPLPAGPPADDTQPAYSPDGKQIAFRSKRDGGGIFLMDAMGGAIRKLTNLGYNPSWSPDGREIAVSTEAAIDPGARYSQSQIFLVDVVTKKARQLLGVSDGVQPSWSPHGQRIAYWGLAQPEAQRAIWTVSKEGGPPVEVVNDRFYNWSPAWSPDGKFLYFASDRGGSMNLWRVGIDERSGSVQGVPQVITTNSEWSALPSLSRDGRLLLYATNKNRSFIEVVQLDPERGQALGPPLLVYQGARAIYTCSISPDGGWLALGSSAPQEDLLLVRRDGGEVRQLTNDPERDRAPRWSPDGSRILFYSNRSGKYEAWTIRPDGSDLTQVTSLPEKVANPFWAPNGRKIGFSYGSHGASILDLSDPASSLHELPPVGDGQIFIALSWSLDERFLAGELREVKSRVPGIATWSLAENFCRRLTRTGFDPDFSRDGRNIIFTDLDEIRMVNVTSGEVRTLLSPPLHSRYLRASVGSGDQVCAVRSTDEGDIWALSLVDLVRHP